MVAPLPNPEIYETDYIKRQPQPRATTAAFRGAPMEQIAQVVERFLPASAEEPS